MMILLIVAIAALAVYLYAAVGYYYGFKNWYPLCGCKDAACGTKQSAAAGKAGE
jgi:hypothetical protein